MELKKVQCEVSDSSKCEFSKRVRFDEGISSTDSGILSVSSLVIPKSIVRVQENPHLEQVCTPLVHLNDEKSLTRVMDKDFPQLIYRRRRGEMKSLIHCGQRKLMISEIEFLTLHGGTGATCVYAGGAPGNHINYLSVLFPHIHFILIDPSEFGCFEDPGYVSIRQEFLTDEKASEIRESIHGDLIFISDIRSADWRTVGCVELDDEITRDMQMQRQWHHVLKAKASMLKFRLPWQPGATDYLDGEIYFPIWAPVTSTESRLVVTSQSSARSWDHQEYWEKMHYFNSVVRASAYAHILGTTRAEDGSVKLDHCYDCAAEVKILKDYLRCAFALGAGGGGSSDGGSNGDSRSLWIGHDELFAEANALASDGAPTEMSLAVAIAIISDRIDSACSVGTALSGGRAAADSQLPFSFSSSRRGGAASKRKRGRQREGQGRGWRAPSLHVTSKSTIEVLRECVECRCSHDQDESEGTCACCLWSVCVRDPDMTDLPYTDTGAWSSLGVGCEVPEGCALDVWLWGALLLRDGRTQKQCAYSVHAVTDATAGPGIHPSEDAFACLFLSAADKKMLLLDFLERETVKRLCDRLVACGNVQYQRVVVFFGQSGYVYMYYLDSAPAVARVNVASGANKNNFGICTGVVVRRKEDGLLSIVLSTVDAWWASTASDQQSLKQIWGSNLKSNCTAQSCAVCSTVLSMINISLHRAVWDSVGIVSVLCDTCNVSSQPLAP
jgi:hypothetical protein